MAKQLEFDKRVKQTYQNGNRIIVIKKIKGKYLVWQK